MTRLAFAMVCAGASLLVAVSAVSSHADAPHWNFKPLQNADVVARGRVLSITSGIVHSADFWMLPDGAPERQSQVTYVSLEVHEVLRGPSLPSEWTFMVYQHSSETENEYPVGEEMLVCGFYHKRLNVYYQTAPNSRYVRTSDGWIADVDGRAITVGDEELRQKIAQVSLDSVARRAELIIEGVVESVDKSRIHGPDSTSAELLTISVRVDRTAKGSPGGSHVQIVVIPRGRFAPSWRKDVPMAYEPGQKWLCMLKRNEYGWYPFAGANGLFRVDGETLIYAERVSFWLSRAQVEEAIRASGGGEGR